YYVLDLDARKFVEQQRIEPILALAMWLRRAPRIAPSGKTTHRYFEAIDTGESREMFGHMARHVITRERTVRGARECRDTVVVHGTRPELGFALQEKQTVTFAVRLVIRRAAIGERERFSNFPSSRSIRVFMSRRRISCAPMYFRAICR
ncbi:MAG: hypothetical protein M3Z85_00035, partial [Acidobacteriota bacterium]|nr:hypothetical protein [Acidobacteriota bacterium]